MTRVGWAELLLLMAVLIRSALGAEATIAPGDRVRGVLAAGGSDTLSFHVSSPCSLDVRTVLDRDLRVTLSVVGPDGTALDAAPHLVDALTRRPALQRLPLLQVGTYRCRVDHVAGTGGYDLRLRLRRHVPRRVDLSTDLPVVTAATFDARDVSFDPDDTTLTSRDVATALHELDDRVAAVTTSTAAHEASITSVIADLAAADVERQVLVADVSALDDRLTTLETGGAPPPNGVRTLTSLRSLSFDATEQDVDGFEHWVVSARELTSVVVDASDLRDFVRVSLAVTGTIVRSGMTVNRRIIGDQARLWVEVGNHRLSLAHGSQLGFRNPVNQSQAAAADLPIDLGDTEWYDTYSGTMIVPEGLSGSVTVRVMFATLQIHDPDDESCTISVIHGLVEAD